MPAYLFRSAVVLLASLAVFYGPAWYEKEREPAPIEVSPAASSAPLALNQLVKTSEPSR